MSPFLETLRKFGATRLGIMAAVAIATLSFFIYVAGRVTTPEMSLLYGDLSVQDSAQIVTELETQQIPYRLSADSKSIYVSGGDVSRTRLLMAEKGLPSGGSIGYELFDEQNALGSTSFVQNINQTRAMEGELSRTIASINSVKSARVHLVLPQRELFSRERQEPSASIVLVTQGSFVLDKSQIVGIQHLVAAAVPGLRPDLVSIIDDKGNLLARGIEESEDMALANSAQERRLAYQTRLRRNVEELLERYVGPGNARVQVTVDMAFDRITENSETYDPDGQVVRSTQTVEEVASEQDNEKGDNVSVENNLPDAGLDELGGDAPTSQSNSQRTEETVNFEISRTVITQVKESGTVNKLSVAVLINDTVTTGEDGERSYSTRTPQEMEKLKAIVQTAVGFDAERGDSVELANFRFAEVDPELLPEEDEVLGFTREEAMRLAELIVLGVVSVILLLMVVRPFINRIFDTDFIREEDEGPDVNKYLYGPDGKQLALAGPQNASPMVPGMPALTNDVGEGAVLAAAQADVSTNLVGNAQAMNSELEQMIDMHKVSGRVRASSVNRIGEIVDNDPEAAVQIIRLWLYQDSVSS